MILKPLIWSNRVRNALGTGPFVYGIWSREDGRPFDTLLAQGVDRSDAVKHLVRGHISLSHRVFVTEDGSAAMVYERGAGFTVYLSRTTPLKFIPEKKPDLVYAEEDRTFLFDLIEEFLVANTQL
jgi:hypothetical protein